MRGVRVGLAVLSFLILFATLPLGAQSSLSLDEVMRRVERYVDDYGDKASVIVGSERYEQHAGGKDAAPETRTLVSEFGIVRADAIRGWLGFRDVLEVDDRPLPDREGRLARVLMASEGRYDEARRLSDESARFNIGRIERNFNVPTTTLFFFNHENRHRFKFAARAAGADGVWEITFRETETPTLIRTPAGLPVRAAGQLWVRADTGTVVRTLLQVSIPPGPGRAPLRGSGRVDVTFTHVASLDMWLPSAMDELFVASSAPPGREAAGPPAGADDWVTGRASYDNYRRFTTSARIK